MQEKIINFVLMNFYECSKYSIEKIDGWATLFYFIIYIDSVKMTHIFHFIIFSILNLIFIEGVHFLGGTISWRPLNTLSTGSSVSIVITQTYSWTYGVVICTPSMIVNNSFVIFQGAHTALDTTYLNCISNCPTSSPGYIAPLIRPHCTDISAPIGTIVGQRSNIVNLTIGDDFVVAFQAAAWRSLKQGTGASWSISSRINLKLRSDNGLYNNAPVATMMSPINIPVNETKITTTPVGDADGDHLRCRWATQANGINECGNVCPPNSFTSTKYNHIFELYNYTNW